LLCWRDAILHSTAEPQTPIPAPLTSGPKPETPNLRNLSATSRVDPVISDPPYSRNKTRWNLKSHANPQLLRPHPTPHSPHPKPQTSKRGSAGGGCRAGGGRAEQDQRRRQLRELRPWKGGWRRGFRIGCVGGAGCLGADRLPCAAVRKDAAADRVGKGP